MIRHIFTLFWNQKKKYGGMFIEQAVVFVVLVFCFVNTGETLARYYTPGMLNTENTLQFGPELKLEGRSLSSEETENMMRHLCETLRTHLSVVAVSECAFFVPYVRSENMNPKDSLKCEGKSVQIYVKGADEFTASVFDIKLEEGRWLPGKILADGTYPAIVTRQLADRFGWHEVVGRNISLNGKACTIVGVMAGLKQEVYKESCPTLILPYEVCGYSDWPEFIVRVRDGELKTFSNLLDRECSRLFAGTNQEIGIYSVEGLKITTMLSNIVSVGTIVIPKSFLLIFTFIGTFGLFWLYSTKRRKEFALRLVVGSTVGGLHRFVILESFVLTVLALLLGLGLFVFVYPLQFVPMLALGSAVVIMIIFSMFSAWWPAYRVSRVNPVEAMREE